jgi:hypothetical protein
MAADDQRTRRPLSAILLTVGGVGAAFAAASCCGLPFLFDSAGIGFAWLTGLAIFSAPTDRFCLSGLLCAWTPLCSFDVADIPHEAFPKVNTTEECRDRILKVFTRPGV